MPAAVGRPFVRLAFGHGSPRTTDVARWLLRIGVAATLTIDAYVHAKDAHFYDFNGAPISQGGLFRIEAGAAVVAAAGVLLWRRRAGWLLALVVAASALAAVVVYSYVNVGKLGPLPNMYEPTWDLPGKRLSAYAEAAATSLAVLGMITTGAGHRPKSTRPR
jgi:hypothetical protein